MANNPFYPGYQPGDKTDENINPMYPGYYAGQPLQKKPSPKNFIKPIEYNLDSTFEAIDNTEKAVLGAINIPKWLAERVADDWKQRLKVSISPPKTDISLTELDDYATENFPGVTTSVSLNPQDWKDPKKQAFKTIKNWTKEATGIDIEHPLESKFVDIENKTSHDLWLHALGYGREGIGVTDRWASDAIARRTAAPFAGLREAEKEFKENPLNLKGVNVGYVDDSGNRVIGKDIYSGVAEAAASFAEQKGNAKNRDEKHTKFLKEAVTAANKEIQHKLKNSNIKDVSILDKHEGAVKMFDIKAQAVTDMYELQEKVLKKASDEVKAAALKPGRTGVRGLGSVWEELDTALVTAKSSQKTRLETAKRLLSEGKINKKSFERLEKNFKEYDNFLNNISTKVSKAKSGRKDDAITVLNSMKGIGEKSLIKRDLFGESIAGGLMKDMEFSLVSNRDGEIGSVIRDDALKSQGVTFKAEGVSAVAHRLRRDRIANATTEVLEAINDPKKAMERYAWSRLKSTMSPRWENFTSGQFIEDKLKKTHWMGLKVEKDYTPEKLNITSQKRLERKIERFDRKYGYKVDLDLDKKYFGIRKLTIKGGGENLKILQNDLLKRFDFKNDKEMLLRILGDGKFKRDDISKKLFKKAWKDLKSDEREKLVGFIREARHYREWAGDLTKQFGDKKPKYALFRYKLFEKIKEKNKELPPGYDLSRKYIGRLEKIHKRMEEIRMKFERSAIGQAIKWVKNWKDITAEKIAELVSKLVAKLLGTLVGSTGVLAALVPVVERVAQFVVKEVVKRVTDFLDALIKGDLYKAFGVLEEAAKKFAFGCLIISAPFFLLVMGIVLLMGSLLGSSVSPVDRTVDTTIVEQEPILPGENPVAKIEKDAKVTLPSGQVLFNPKQISNTELDGVGIKVDYTVKVTAKITIFDGSVFFTDEMRRINSNGSRTIRNFGTQYVNPFQEWVTYDFPLPTVDLSGGSYKDSLIINTATLYTPAVPSKGIIAGKISAVNYFKIGNFVPACPLGLAGDFKILTLSYGIPGSHGSPEYCAVLPDICAGNIPFSWGHPCQKDKCTYWGYALDVSTVNFDCGGNAPVTLPSLGGAQRWRIIRTIDLGPGQRGFEAITTDGKWRITYLHINNIDLYPGKVVNSGDVVAELECSGYGVGSHPHVHIELFDMTRHLPNLNDLKNGIPVKPECYMCGENFDLYNCD